MAYEVKIDRKKCVGAGYCEKLMPSLFKVDSRNKVALVWNGKKNLRSVKITKTYLEAAASAAKVCPVFAIQVLKSGKSILNIAPDVKTKVRKIKAHYSSRKEWVMDKKGFFTIKPFPQKKIIKVRYYNAKYQLSAEIEGKNAEEIYNTLCRENLISLLSHAAYLGSELQKAEIAMKKGTEYIQDEPLKI